MTYQVLSYQSDTGPRAGLRIGEQIYDAAALSGEPAYATVIGALQQWNTADSAFRAAELRMTSGQNVRSVQAIADARLLAPVLFPGAIYCAGANYLDHVQEMDKVLGHGKSPTLKELGELPWHFLKTPCTSVLGPGSVVNLPAYSKSVDWEIELVAVIGRTAKDVPVQRALEYVAGYTIANDLSARDALIRTKTPASMPFRFDWVSSKNFDGSCPLGPWITPASDIGDPHNLALKLWVDGVLMQDSNTSQMIFDTAEQIAAISSRVTLHPGDLVLTGTPAGVGLPRNVFLKAGQTVKLWVEKIGEFDHSIA